jgi:Protein of unknown function (DUF1566)
VGEETLSWGLSRQRQPARYVQPLRLGEPINSEPSGTAFTVFLKTLNDQRFANHSDWRLPTNQQLLDIVDHSQTNPRIDPIFGPTQGNFYWLADTCEAGSAWMVNFANFQEGFESRCVFRDNESCVRAVRGASPTSLLYGQSYQILNGYNNFSGGRMVADPGGCSASLGAMGDNLNCVSCISNLEWQQRYISGSVWKILSAEAKVPGSPVMFGDVIHLQAGLATNQQKFSPGAEGGYLDTRGGGCQDNHLCVSTSGSMRTEMMIRQLLSGSSLFLDGCSNGRC